MLKHGAKIDLKCGGKGYTPAMWAAWRNHLEIVKFLKEHGADFKQISNQGDNNILDICVIRMSYETALYVKKNTDLELKPAEYFDKKTAVEYDVELFL